MRGAAPSRSNAPAARQKKQAEPLPTIWHADDRLWGEVEAVLTELDPPAQFGPERIDQRKAFDRVIYRMRSGVQWNYLPKEYGDDSSIHRTFQRWVKRGVIERLWGTLVKAWEELGGVDWQWQSADCSRRSSSNTDMTTTETTTAASGTKAPTHVAYQVREGKDKSFWTRIGVAWSHKDGKGFNLQLECVPLDGRVQLRVATESK